MAALPQPVTCPYCRRAKIRVLEAGQGRTVSVDLGDDPHGEVEYRAGRAYPVGSSAGGGGRRLTPHGCQQAREAPGARMLGNVIVLPGHPQGVVEAQPVRPGRPAVEEPDEVTAARRRRWKAQLPAAEMQAVEVFELAGFEVEVLAEPVAEPMVRSGRGRAAR
jgi:hypothetical protein